MDFNEFLERVRVKVDALLPDDLSTEYRIIQKNNGVSYTGICLKPGNIPFASPTLYMEPYFVRLPEDPEEVLNRISEEIGSVLFEKSGRFENWKDLKDPEYVKTRVIYRLVGKEGNEEWLADKPKRSYLDMWIIYTVILRDKREGTGFAIVTDKVAESLGFSEEDLYGFATANTKRLMGEQMTCIRDVLGLDFNDLHSALMYVLTNERGIFGAAAVLYTERLMPYAEFLERDLYVLPSSVHEMVVIPYDREQYDIALRMVRAVNDNECPKEDVLTNSVYVFERATGTLRIGP